VEAVTVSVKPAREHNGGIQRCLDEGRRQLTEWNAQPRMCTDVFKVSCIYWKKSCYDNLQKVHFCDRDPTV